MTVVAIIIIALLAAACAAAIFMWSVQRRAADSAAAALRESEERVRTLIKEKSEAEARLAYAERQQAERAKAEEVMSAERERAEEAMKAQFRNLANDVLAEQSRRFKESNKESMDVLLKPFRDNITEFRERVERIYSAENEQHGALRNELKNLMELNRRITAETANLTSA